MFRWSPYSCGAPQKMEDLSVRTESFVSGMLLGLVAVSSDFSKEVFFFSSFGKKNCQLQQVAQECVHSGVEYLHRWRLHKLSCPTVPMFDNTHSKRVIFFLISRQSCLYLNLCSLCLVLSLGTTEKTLSLSLLLGIYTHL